VTQEESERIKVDGMKKGSDSTGKVMHMKKKEDLKGRLVL